MGGVVAPTHLGVEVAVTNINPIRNGYESGGKSVSLNHRRYVSESFSSSYEVVIPEIQFLRSSVKVSKA